jgi:mannosyltransferase
MPLGSSFWLDETATFWIVKNGPREIVSRWSQWGTAQSLPYSWIAWAGMALGGRSEIALRLPSLLAMALATFLLFKLASHLVGEDAAWPTVLIFLSCEDVAFAAVDARPYAFALLTLIASTLLLVRWMQTGRDVFALGYAVLVPVTVYFHFFFAIAFLSHVAYVLYCLRAGAPVRRRSIVLVLLMAGLLLTPYSVRSIRLMHDAHALSFSPTPRLDELFARLIPPVLTFGVVLGALLAHVLQRELRFVWRFHNRAAAALILSGWLLPILTLFVVSIFTPAKVFVGRYMLPAAPGMALIAGAAIKGFEPSTARVLVVAVVTMLGMVTSTGRRIWPLHGDQDWRGAMATVRTVASDNQFPIVISSGYIEAAIPSEFSQLTPTSRLLSPLAMYPVGGRIIAIPDLLDENTIPFVEQLSAQTLDGCDRFVLVLRERDNLESWFRGHFGPLGFRITQQGQHRGVEVLLFEKPNTSSSPSLLRSPGLKCSHCG